MVVWCDGIDGEVTTDEGVKIQFVICYDENEQELKPVVVSEARDEHGDIFCDELEELLNDDPLVQAELSYRRNLYQIGTHHVNQRDWNDWEWYAMRRVSVDISVPITEGYVGDVVAGFRDQLN